MNIKPIIALPALAAAAHGWQPAADLVLTEWGAKVTPENAWVEHPRPMMQRKGRTNLNGLRKQGVAAGIYTQTTHVESEIDGLITYDRKVRKVTAETLAAIHLASELLE